MAGSRLTAQGTDVLPPVDGAHFDRLADSLEGQGAKL
jgi:hypothetical protein